MSGRRRSDQLLVMPPSPAGIVIGYLVVLFAVVAGTVAFPFSSICMALLFVVVGAFFVVAVPMIVMAYVFMAIAFCRAFLGLCRRLILGSRPIL